MNKEHYLEMKRTIGPTVAANFAKDAGISPTQVQLWNTQEQAMRNCKVPLSISMCLQRKATVTNSQQG